MSAPNPASVTVSTKATVKMLPQLLDAERKWSITDFAKYLPTNPLGPTSLSAILSAMMEEFPCAMLAKRPSVNKHWSALWKSRHGRENEAANPASKRDHSVKRGTKISWHPKEKGQVWKHLFLYFSEVPVITVRRMGIRGDPGKEVSL